MASEKKVISQKEYLKKYLSSGDGEEKKKKKKKAKLGPKAVKIIDDDIDLKNMRPIEENEFDILIDNEDAPQIVGVVDERGPVDFSDKRRWRIIADEDHHGDISITSHEREPRRQREKERWKNQGDSEDDLSPPRSKGAKSKEKKSRDIDSDQSPPRRKEKKKEKKMKKVRSSTESESDSDSDSPPRKSRKKKRSKSSKEAYDSDLSPPRNPKSSKHKKEEDSDLSPPRKKKNHKKDSDSDLSPPRKKKKNHKRDSDSDLSPPRKKKKNHKKNSDSDSSPPRRKKKSRKDSDSDLSPVRQSRKHEKSNRRQRDSDSDLSPPRKSKKSKEDGEFDLSPPRRTDKVSKSKHSNASSSRQKRDDDSDLSPPRKSRKDKHSPSRSSETHRTSRKTQRRDMESPKPETPEYNSDLSPPRKRNRDTDRNPSPPTTSEENRKDHSSLNKSKTDKSRDRQDDARKYRPSRDHRKERSSRWNEDRRSSSPDHRDKRMKKTLDGKTAGLQDAKALREETEAHKKREAEHFSKLSKEVSGVGKAAIVRDTKTGRKRDLEAEAAEEREKQKRQEELDEKYAKWGRGLKQVEDREEKLKDDLYEMSKPLARYADDADLDKQLREQEREGDPMLEYIKQKQIKEGKRKPDRPKYEGSFMPNRFGIKPGHRWDGVDRSNGYEKRWFEAQNAKVARQEEAYKWSTSDM